MNADIPSVAPQRRRAFLSRRFPADVEQRIASRYDAVRNDSDIVLDPEHLAQQAQGCHYLFISAMENVNRFVLKSLSPTLRAVATLSAGFNHIDMKAARELASPSFTLRACSRAPAPKSR